MNIFSYDLDDNQELFFSKLLLRQTGVDYLIHDSKNWTDQIKVFIKRKRFKNVDTLIEKLKCGDTELLIELLTLFKPNELGFYHNTDQLKYCNDVMIPQFIKQGVQQQNISVWCAGCNKGEETYSFSAIFDQQMIEFPDWKVSIMGTDVFPSDIDFATAGIYPKESFQNEAATKLADKYFQKVGDHYQLDSDKIREITRFQIYNLQDDVDNYQQYDLICCRTHFKQMVPEWRHKIFDSFVKVLKPWGYLILNKIDSPLGITNSFSCIPGHPGIYQLSD